MGLFLDGTNNKIYNDSYIVEKSTLTTMQGDNLMIRKDSKISIDLPSYDVFSLVNNSHPDIVDIELGTKLILTIKSDVLLQDLANIAIELRGTNYTNLDIVSGSSPYLAIVGYSMAMVTVSSTEFLATDIVEILYANEAGKLLSWKGTVSNLWNNNNLPSGLEVEPSDITTISVTHKTTASTVMGKFSLSISRTKDSNTKLIASLSPEKVHDNFWICNLILAEYTSTPSITQESDTFSQGKQKIADSPSYSSNLNLSNPNIGSFSLKEVSGIAYYTTFEGSSTKEISLNNAILNGPYMTVNSDSDDSYNQLSGTLYIDELGNTMTLSNFKNRSDSDGEGGDYFHYIEVTKFIATINFDAATTSNYTWIQLIYYDINATIPIVFNNDITINNFLTVTEEVK